MLILLAAQVHTTPPPPFPAGSCCAILGLGLVFFIGFLLFQRYRPIRYVKQSGWDPLVPPSVQRLPYDAIPSVLTRGELAFFDVLMHVVAGRYQVLAKVRLADLVEVTDNSPNRRAWFMRISQKHIDFVLCDRPSMRPLLLIELDDRSHHRGDRVERDDFVNQCLDSAGLM